MFRIRPLPTVVVFVALLSAFALSPRDEAASPGSAKSGADAADEKGSLAVQVKELRKQMADLQARLGELPKVGVVAVGTATWVRPDTLANRTTVHVNLPADVVAQLGKGYLVLLTNRFPQFGYPYLAPYWTPGTNGFDIALVETSLANGSTVEYARANRNYLVDWIVVKR